MSANALTQFLVDVTRGHLAANFARDGDALIAASGLSDALQRAIRTHDIGQLWLAGAHPMALLYFARSCGWSADRYYECISTAGARAGHSPAA